MKKDFILKTKKDNILRISTFDNNENKMSPCLIYVHGFKGFKEWGFIPDVGDYFSNRGFFVITFNFSHNGVGESLTEFNELEKFAKNTVSLEVEELTEIIDAYTAGFFCDKQNQKIGIIGHSRGGGVSLITASQRKSVDAVAVWASISKFDRYTHKQKASWQKKGFSEVLNSRTNQMMKLNLDLLKDIEKNKDDKLNIEKSVKNFNKPLFIAHGDKDASVPFSEAKELYNWSDKELTHFLEIPGTGHTFEVVHPFERSNPKFEMLLEETNSFFNKYLN
jgi:dienelactone hydrolase